MEKNDSKSNRTKTSEFIRTWCAYFILHYELITCTCMFEPWEKYFINGLVLTIFTIFTYSSWLFLTQVFLFSYGQKSDVTLVPSEMSAI